MALGYAGQYIIVDHAQNMVAVFLSALRDRDFAVPERLYNSFILDSIRSDKAIPGNKQTTENQKRLKDIINKVAQSKPQPVPPLPSTAETISGKTWYFESNPANYKWLRFTFTDNEGSSNLIIEIAYRNKQDRVYKYPVGLDNVYRNTLSHRQTPGI